MRGFQENCTRYEKNLWKQNYCKNCFKAKEQHDELFIPDETTKQLSTVKLDQQTTQLILSLLFFYIDDLSDFNSYKILNRHSYSQAVIHYQLMRNDANIWKKEIRKNIQKSSDISIDSWIPQFATQDEVPYIAIFGTREDIRLVLRYGKISDNCRRSYADYLFKTQPVDWRWIYLHVRLMKKIYYYHFDRIDRINRSHYTCHYIDTVDCIVVGPFKCDYGVKIFELGVDFEIRGEYSYFGVAGSVLEEINDWNFIYENRI